MPIVANNVVVREPLPKRTGSGRTFHEIRSSSIKKVKTEEVKKKRIASAYQHDMTTVHKV